MNAEVQRQSLRQRILALIERLADGSQDDAARDALLHEVAAWQRRHVEPYQRFCASVPSSPSSALQPPALPTAVFRHTRVAAHSPAQDLRCFVSSGTTQAHRSQHPFRDLALYESAAHHAAQRWLFGAQQWSFVLLAADAQEASDSSLSFMLSRFADWFSAAPAVYVWRHGKLQVDALRATLQRLTQASAPVALLGTSFAFVHAEDALAGETFGVPPGSLLLHTGGFKGRSRQVAPLTLHAQLAKRYGLPLTAVRLEYGMTELSSQLYDVGLDAATQLPLYTVPGWVRASVLHPQTLAPLPRGEVGVLRLDDLANLDSCCCLLTEDLARWTPAGLCLHGRSSEAPERGCSLRDDIELADG